MIILGLFLTNIAQSLWRPPPIIGATHGARHLEGMDEAEADAVLDELLADGLLGDAGGGDLAGEGTESSGPSECGEISPPRAGRSTDAGGR